MHIFRAAAAVLGVIASAGPVSAFDGLTFNVVGSEELTAELRQSSLLVQAENEDVTDAIELLAAARADYGRLVGTLYSEGHYGGVINIVVDGQEVATISPLARPGRINSIVVTVRPGPNYRFSRTEIGPLAPETDLPDTFRVGEIARSGVIRDAAEISVDAWRQAGRAKADVVGQSVVAQHDADRLAVDIDLGPGPVVTFGDLVIRGTPEVRPERIRAIAGLPTGEVFDPDAVALSQQRLRATEVFATAALSEAETLGPGNRMDIIADLVAGPPRRIGAGAELATTDGLTLSGFWLHRNLLGGAERLRFDAEVSGIGGQTGGIDYRLGTRFERPATFSPKNTLFLEAEIEHLEEPDFTQTSGTIGAGINRVINERVEVEYGLAYRFSAYEDDVDEFDYSQLILPLSATYDDRNEPLDATRGFFLDLGLSPFLGLNDQSDSGARLTFDGRAYRGFGAEDRFVLAGRVQGGSILGASLEGVPADFRFYSGGGGTVRGQEYQSLGVDLNGADSGGGSFVGASAELRAGVTDAIGVVLFADYGVVGFDSWPDGDSDDHAGAGLGVRYRTPIGPIRLDVAGPIAGDSQGVEVYIGIGQAF